MSLCIDLVDHMWIANEWQAIYPYRFIMRYHIRTFLDYSEDHARSWVKELNSSLIDCRESLSGTELLRIAIADPPLSWFDMLATVRLRLISLTRIWGKAVLKFWESHSQEAERLTSKIIKPQIKWAEVHGVHPQDPCPSAWQWRSYTVI